MKKMILILIVFEMSTVFARSLGFVVKFVNKTDSDISLTCVQYQKESGDKLDKLEHEITVIKNETLERMITDDFGSKFKCSFKKKLEKVKITPSDIDLLNDNKPIYLLPHKR